MSPREIIAAVRRDDRFKSTIAGRVASRRFAEARAQRWQEAAAAVDEIERKVAQQRTEPASWHARVGHRP